MLTTNMGTDRAQEFWTNDNKYQDLAKAYESGVEQTHPPYITSDGRGCGFCGLCVWERTAVTYREYRGPSIESLKGQ